MNKHRIASLLLAVLMMVSFSMVASAVEYEAADYTLTLPQEYCYTLTPYTDEGSAMWALAGVSDPASAIDEYQDSGVKAEFFTEDGESVKLRESSSDYTEKVYHLSSLTDEEQQEFLEDKLPSSQSDDAAVTKGLRTYGGQTFYYVQIDVTSEDQEAHEVILGTVLNGRTVAFDIYQTVEIDSEQLTLLDKLAESFTVTYLMPKPEEVETSPWLLAALLLVLLGVVIAPAITIPLNKRRSKRQKEETARQMEEYRRTHGDTLSGEVRFVNRTDCTKEMVHIFASYHAYQKNWQSLVLGGVLCFGVVLAAFLFDLTWWVKLMAVVVTLYYLYQVINTPRTIERAQLKVFSRGVSETATYHFHEDGFRVAGIQSGNAYPYLHILSVKKSGQYLYLYYSPDNMYPVDRYGFAENEDESLRIAEEFERFIKEKTEQKGTIS